MVVSRRWVLLGLAPLSTSTHLLEQPRQVYLLLEGQVGTAAATSPPCVRLSFLEALASPLVGGRTKYPAALEALRLAAAVALVTMAAAGVKTAIL